MPRSPELPRKIDGYLPAQYLPDMPETKLSVQYVHPLCELCKRGDCIQEVKPGDAENFPMIIHGHGMEHLTGSWCVEEGDELITVFYTPWKDPNPPS